MTCCWVKINATLQIFAQRQSRRSTWVAYVLVQMFGFYLSAVWSLGGRIIGELIVLMGLEETCGVS